MATEGTPMTFHQILHEIQSNPEMAKSFVAQLCHEGYLLGMKTIEDILALPAEDLTDIALHMFPSFFLRECDPLNEWKH